MSSADVPTPVSSPVRSPRGRRRDSFSRKLKWRAEALAFQIFEAALGCLPVTWVARLGRSAGTFAYRTLSRRRRAVLRNLRIAFAGERSDAELRAMTAEVFRRAGANLLCSLRTARLEDGALGRIVEIRDEHVLRDAAAAGRGVVVLLAHMGNWEALAQWLPKFVPKGVPAATVYRPLNNPYLNARVEAARRRRGLELFSKRDNPLSMASFLRRGGLLAVLADQRVGGVGELVPFFGRWTSCTPIPAILARRTGAATVGVSLSTIGEGRWELRFHALDSGEPSTAGMMKLVERMMRVSPADVFWLQERWRNFLKRPELQPGKVSRHQSEQATKRRRVVLWAGLDGTIPNPPAPSPDDVDYELVLAAGASDRSGADLDRAIARVHRRDERAVEAFLDAVDRDGPLPIDYVVTVGADVEVSTACARLGIGAVEVAR